MTAHPDETPTEPAVAVDPPPTGSPVGHLEPEKALATWRAMERSSPERLDVGMLWADRPEPANMRVDATRPPVHGERRWLATQVPDATTLASLEMYGDAPAAAWISLAGRVPRLFVWSYRPSRHPAMLDVEVHEAVGLFCPGPGKLWTELLWTLDTERRPAWRRCDDLGVRVLCHRLAMFCLGPAVARPLQA